MKSHRVIAFLVGCLVLAASGAPRASAVEPAREFLQALREAGYYDMALEYLDKVQGSKLVPPSFREIVLYEKGVTLVESSRQQRDMSVREKQLDQAQAMFKEFIAKNQTNPLVTSANSQLGNLTVERARMKVEQAKASNDDAKKKQLLDEARPMYQGAQKLFADLQEQVRVKLEQIPKVLPAGSPLIPVRDQLRIDYLQSLLLEAAVTEEMADTMVEGSKEYNDQVASAAEKYKTIYEQYRTRLAGLYARLYQGRCHYKINDRKNALSFFTDLLEQPNDPAFRLLKKKTLLWAVEIWLDPKEPKYIEAIRRLEPLVDTLNQAEQQDIEWLKLQMALVKAYKVRIEALKNDKPQPPEVPLSINKGRALLRFLMRTPSDFQEEAQQLATFFEVRPIGVGDGEPQNFVEAMEAGREALGAMQTAPKMVQTLTQQIAGTQDAEQKAELQQQLEAQQQLAQESPENARRLFHLALEMADETTPIDDVNLAQYFLTYLYYARGDMWDAALLGEFVASRYPGSAGARQCAKISMACYLKLYSAAEAAGESKDFETRHTIDICKVILERWPTEPEANDAANMLISLILQGGDVNQAVKYIEGIPADAPYRGMAELRTGQALWAKYDQGRKAALQIADEKERQAELNELQPFKTKAEQILADGVSRMKDKGGMDETLATAMLSLAQIYVDTDQAQKAIELCEAPQIGVLTLVRANDPSTAKEGFAQQAYITALRGYVSSLAVTSDPDKTIEKARQIMAELKTSMGEGPEAEKKLVSIYYSMANSLKDQVASAEGPSKAALTQGAETFFRQVGSESNELNVLNMVAESFFGLAEGNDKRGSAPGAPTAISKEAKKFYDEAIKSYQKIIDKGAADKDWLPSDVRLQVKYRMATVKRQLGDFKGALAMYKEVLEENNIMLNVQAEAARTYQQWADQMKDPAGRTTLYVRAMQGSYPDERQQIGDEKNRNYRKNTIWGWGRLAKETQRYPQFRDMFHEGRYNLALCRYRYALLRESKEEVRKYEEMAKGDIEATYNLYPDLGGDDWTKKYDTLLKEIQKELGEDPVGLAAFKPADVAAQ